MSVWRSDHDRDHRPVSQVSSGESSAVTAAADNCSTVCTLATQTLRSPDLPSSTVLCAAIHRWPGSEESCCVECSLRCSWSGGVGPVKWWSVTKQVLMSEHSDPALCPSVCCSSTLASHLHCRTRPADPAPRSTGEWRVRECSFLHPLEIATHAHKSCKSQPTTTVRDHQGEQTVIIPLLLISRKWIASCHSTTRSQNSSSTRVSQTIFANNLHTCNNFCKQWNTGLKIANHTLNEIHHTHASDEATFINSLNAALLLRR